VKADQSKKARKYKLAPEFEKLFEENAQAP